MTEDAKPSLLEIARSRVKKKGPDCGIAIAFRLRPEAVAEATDLIAACPDEVPYSVASATLRDAGLDIKADTISRHKRGLCGCNQ